VKVEEEAEAEEEEEVVDEGEEGEERPPKPPKAPPKEEVSKWAEGTFGVVADGEAVEALPVRNLMTTLFLCKTGYGEPALRFAIKLVDPEGGGALKEPELWFAITRSANLPLDATTRNHLRRAWRAAEKQPLPGEGADPEEAAAAEAAAAAEVAAAEDAAVAAEATAAAAAAAAAAANEEGSEEEDDVKEAKKAEAATAAAAAAEARAAADALAAARAAPKPKPSPADVKVLVDDYIAKVSEDERLAAVLLAELTIPEPSKSADEDLPPAADD